MTMTDTMEMKTDKVMHRLHCLSAGGSADVCDFAEGGGRDKGGSDDENGMAIVLYQNNRTLRSQVVVFYISSY